MNEQNINNGMNGGPGDAPAATARVYEHEWRPRECPRRHRKGI